MKPTLIKRFLLIFLSLAVCLLSSCIALGPTLEDLERYDELSKNQAEDSEVESSASSEAESSESGNESAILGDKTMTVHFIDVWQGDSIFIELPNGECMLIDAGERDYAGRVVSLIDCLGYTKIDYIVATHPHSDHIGGMQRVIESFEIGKIYMPEAVTDTATFINLLEAIDAKGCGITPVTAGLAVDFGGASGVFVAPTSIVENLNDCSAVFHLSYGEKSFLFTGDAESAEEATFKGDVRCDVLKVGHHGSYTSSSDAFLKKAGAQIAVISCGEGNDYGHPHDAALNRLKKNGIEKIYRTDVSGTISIKTDGKNLSVKEGTEPENYIWVLNIGNKKVHRADCNSALEMNPNNKAYSKRSIEELAELGFGFCGSCKPDKE